MTREEAVDVAMDLIREELERATAKFGPFASAHEGFAVIDEEFLELREAVYWPHKVDPTTSAAAQRGIEAKQLGAMAARFLADCVVPELYG